MGSWFEPVLTEKFDIVICNPPYVPKGQENSLSQDAAHEPEQAHYPEDNSPEDLYRKLFKQTREVLAPDGLYIFEIGFGQFGANNFDVIEFAASLGLSAEIISDKNGIERFVKGRIVDPKD